MRQLERFVGGLQWLAAVLLGFLAVMSIVAFLRALIAAVGPGFFTSVSILALLDDLFVLFILIELIEMAFAYIRKTNIVPAALEAVVIAIARKTVALDFTVPGVEGKAEALALVTVSVGVTWFLIGRSKGLSAAENRSDR